MDSETCLNRSCSKVETLLRRTDTFDPVSFLYASFHAFLKRKTVKRILLQMDNIFSHQIKKNTLLYGNTKISGIAEKQRIKLEIFVNFLKKKHFFTLQNNIFFISICSFEGVQHFDSNSLSFIPTCSLQPTNNCFRATASDIDLQTILRPFMNYWFQDCDLL